MSTLIFKLAMPNRASWNGRWSGEETLYAIVKSMGASKKAKTKTEELLKARSWYHNFGDGWGASVTVSEATPAEARTVRKKTRGFCGYDWMVRDILDHGYIGDPKPVSLGGGGGVLVGSETCAAEKGHNVKADPRLTGKRGAIPG